MKRTLLFVVTAFTNILLANADPITKAQALSIATKYINNPKLSNDTQKPAHHKLMSNQLITFLLIQTTRNSLLSLEKVNSTSSWVMEIR